MSGTSKAGSRSARPVATAVLLLAVLAAGCGGGDGGSTFLPDIRTGRFIPSSTAGGPNLVRLTGSADAGDRLTVDVVIGGPTASRDLYTFAFDLAIGDPEVLDFVDNSAVVGSVLTSTGCAGPPTVLATTVNSRSQIVVGVSKLGTCPGDAVSGGEPSIVRLTFRVLKKGSSTLSISGTPAVFDAAGDPIQSIQFDIATATVQVS